VLLDLLAACPALARLSLSHCELLTERGVFYVAMQCTQLLELRLRACDGLADEAVLQAVHDCASPIRLLELPSGRLFRRGEAGSLEEVAAPNRSSAIGVGVR